MNIALIIALIILAAFCEKKTAVYFLAYGLGMIGVNSAALQIVPLINPAHAHYYYLIDATLISYITFFIPKIKDNTFILSVCGISIFANILGEFLWHLGIYPAFYASTFTMIYVVSCLYLIKKGSINAIHDRLLHKLRGLYMRFCKSDRGYLGGDK